MLLGVGVTLRRPSVPAERALAATAALLWLATLAAAPRAPTHAAALLLPAAALTRQLPRPLQLLLVAAAAALVAATVPPFLRGTLP